MTTILQFQGYSDDLVHVAVDGVIEEYNVLSPLTQGKPATFVVMNSARSDNETHPFPIFYINADYGVNSGTWTFGIEQFEEDIFLPALEVIVASRRNVSPYSTVLTILIADENIDAYVVLK